MARAGAAWLAALALGAALAPRAAGSDATTTAIEDVAFPGAHFGEKVEHTASSSFVVVFTSFFFGTLVVCTATVYCCTWWWLPRILQGKAELSKEQQYATAREPQPYSLHTPRSDLYGTPRLERYGTPRLDPYGTPRRYSGPSPRSGSPSPRPDLLMLRDAPRPVV